MIKTLVMFYNVVLCSDEESENDATSFKSGKPALISSREESWQALRCFHMAPFDLKRLWSLSKFPLHSQ